MNRILGLFLASIATAASFGQTGPKPISSPEMRRRLDQNVPQWLKDNDVPSAAVGIIENGKVAWTAVYGEQSPGVPATERTLYNVASLTKPISAEVILRLASRGTISLDEPLSAYWIDPDVVGNPWNKLLTPRLCLSHQTGFPNWRYQTNNILKFQWEPGTRFGYSGEGYDYVARFAEKKTGASFEELTQKYVFNPIGMKDTAYTPRPGFKGRLAVPFDPQDEDRPTARTTWSAADLLRTTIGDYTRFVVSVMHNKGLTRRIASERLVITRNLVTQDQKNKMCPLIRPGATDCELTAGLGLGWQAINMNGETIVDHGGTDKGVYTLAFFIPESGLGVVVFTNGENGIKVIRNIVETVYPNPAFIATIN